MNDQTLGILGGLGPMSGVLFCQLLTEHTKAEKDSEHMNFLLSSRADTPDRTDFILGISNNDPAPVMIEEVKKLVDSGADIIAIPCNTAHYFYERIAATTSVPIINIIDQTVAFCRSRGLKKVGVMATAGTSSSGAYKSTLEKSDIELVKMTEDEQRIISDVIYNKIKKGLLPEKSEFDRIADALRSRGAEGIILGCTELSILKRCFDLGDDIIDSLEVLALCAIRSCEHQPIGFDEDLMNFYPERKIHNAVN